MDVGKMKEVAQEPATPAEALETIPDGVDLEAYKRCLEYCQAQGVNLDTFKFIGLVLDKLHVMLKKPELSCQGALMMPSQFFTRRLNLLVNLPLSWQTLVLP